MHDSTESVIFTWGKYRGYSLAHVYRTNYSYLEWIIKTVGIPEIWKTAAKMAIAGEDVSSLNLSRAKTVQKNKTEENNDAAVTIKILDKKTAAVIMPYNPALMSKFKYAVDGRSWNPKEKHWEFPLVHLQAAFDVFGAKNISCDQKVLDTLNELVERRKDLDELRQQEDIVDFIIKGLKVPLYPYQKVGVKFIERTAGRCMIADVPGLGKTAQAIGFAQHKNLKTLIVCPLSVVINWQRQIERFTGKKSTIWDTKKKTGRSSNQFHITHYDAVGKIAGELRKEGFELLVCDEATYLKNRRTIRAKSILGSYQERKRYPGIKTKYCLFLTGTPVMSRPIEAFSLLSYLDKDRFNNFYHFVQRYGGWKGEQSRNLMDLHERTKDLVIRRTWKDIKSELPEKQRNDLYVDMTPAERKQYNTLLQELFGIWKMDAKPTIGTIPKIQQFLIDRKMPRLLEMVDELIDNDEPVLIFSNYVKPLKDLAEHYGKKAALLTGDMNKTERQKSIDKLVSGEAKVGCFSLMAAGMGIDGLQEKIRTVVFLNMDWVPANHQQAEDRTYRTGQKRQVQVYYMMCADTIDEYMRDILKEKQQVADLVVDGALITPERKKSFFKEFVRKLSAAYKQEFSLENIED